jgi:hypothetical protein
MNSNKKYAPEIVNLECHISVRIFNRIICRKTNSAASDNHQLRSNSTELYHMQSSDLEHGDRQNFIVHISLLKYSLLKHSTQAGIVQSV